MWRRCWRRRVGTVLVLGGAGMVYALGALYPSRAFDLRFTRSELIAQVVAAAAFVSVEYPLARRRSRRHHDSVFAWAGTSVGPSPEETAGVHDLPGRHARAVLAEWAAATVIAVAIHTVVADGGTTQAVVLLLGANLLGLHMAWIVFLLTEGALRDLFAIAPDLRARPLAWQLWVRLAVTVVLCAGIATVGAVLLATWPTNQSGVHLAQATVPLAAFVLLEGFAVLAWTFRGLSDTVNHLREGLAAVEGGDLSAQVAVDDRTEIGALQASFNRMVVGLRDRDLLQRLLAEQVGASVADASRAHGSRIGGERHHVSVLFVDMLGSTRMAHEVAPERMVDLLNGFFDLVVRRIDAHGGIVLQFQGDGAICLFGAPDPLPGHQRHALIAARHLRDDLLRYGVANPGFLAAVAVSTGDAVVGHLGSDDRHTYTAIGDAVNQASRLLEVAKRSEGGLLAAETTVRAAGEEAERWNGADPVTVRGLDQPVAVCVPRADPRS